jgi:hypothetical protein
MFGDVMVTDQGLIGPIPDGIPEQLTYEDHVVRLNEALKVIRDRAIGVQRRVMELRMDKSPVVPTQFEVGDRVLVSFPNRPDDKLTPVWQGPFLVVEIKNQSYFCQDPLNLQVTEYFIDRLKLYRRIAI